MDEPPSEAPPNADAQKKPTSTPTAEKNAQRLRVFILGLCATAAVVQCVALLMAVFLLPPAQQLSDDTFISLIVVRCSAILVAVLGAWLARRGKSMGAVGCLIGSILAVVFVMQLATIATGYTATGIWLSFGLYPLAIVLAGITSNQRFLLVTAGVAGLLSIIVTLSLPTDAILLTLPTALLIEGGTTAIVFLFITNYLATMQDLAAARLAYERMKQTDNLKEQFITSVNHELRNPIMAMLGYLDLLRIQRNRASLERLDMIVDEANQAGQDLRALLNSILETRRLDQGIENFTPQAVNVREVIAVAVRLIDPREATMHDRELRIRVASHFHIWGDPVHLQQIFTNLISNAVKYSPPDAPVEVTAAHVMRLHQIKGSRGRMETQSRQMVEIMVRDYGLGIPPEQAPLLFQRFARLPRDLASKVVGNGLGLYLCRALAEVMGGTIWVESSGVSGKGSTFFVQLQVPPSEPTPPSVIETSKAELRL